MYDNIEKQTYDKTKYDFFVGVHFETTQRSYYFGVKDLDIKLNDKVIVETVRGIELGEVTLAPHNISEYHFSLELKPVIRIATEKDEILYENNKKDAVFAMKICQNEIKNLNLKMNLLSCEYTLDKAKIMFVYFSEERVDFRELIKILASRLHTRIDLKQIGSRDKAKIVGGIGLCGRPLCCVSFLNEFDGISINRAKNQMLSINVPKLSGQCGKLMCCLKYEDDDYSKAKEKFPNPGFKVFVDKVQYTVSGFNVISNTIKLENEDGVIILDYNDFIKQTGYHPRKKED